MHILEVKKKQKRLFDERRSEKEPVNAVVVFFPTVNVVRVRSECRWRLRGLSAHYRRSPAINHFTRWRTADRKPLCELELRFRSTPTRQPAIRRVLSCAVSDLVSTSGAKLITSRPQ